jgi:hypothetical protein
MLCLLTAFGLRNGKGYHYSKRHVNTPSKQDALKVLPTCIQHIRVSLDRFQGQFQGHWRESVLGSAFEDLAQHGKAVSHRIRSVVRL